MGCMVARRLGLSSCAILFLCGIFGGFLMAGMMVTPPLEPMPLTSSSQVFVEPDTARSSGSAAAAFEGTGGLTNGGNGGGGDDKEAARGSLSAPSAPLPRPATKDELETFEPVIRAPIANAKSLPEGKVPRPRFYAQELGTHQKLYVAVLTSPETVHREATNINHTLAHITSSIGFYMVGESDVDLPKNLHNVVIFPPETDSESLPTRTAEYLANHFGNLYDFFFIVRDNTYVRGYRLKELAEDLSVSTDVLLGAREGHSCKLDGGLLLSRQLLVYASERKAECAARHETAGLSGDRALVSCLELVGGTHCSDRAQGKWFVSQPSEQYDPSSDSDQRGLLSIQAVHSAAEHSRLHAAFSRLEIAEIDQRIGQLRRALEDNQKNLHALSRAKTGDDAGEDAGEPEPLPWPTGSPAPVRTTSRHHVNMWQRFSETDMFLRTEQRVVDRHTEVDRLDIKDVMELGMAELQKTAPLSLVRLRAGYRRFDGTRGMDYILDLEVQPVSGGATQIRRVEVHRPILKAELVPIPFVTEKPTVSILLSVQWYQVERAASFVQELINRNENVALMLFLMPGESGPGVFDTLRKLVRQANERRSAQAGSHRFEAVVWPHRSPPTQFQMVDTVADQTRGRWQQALILLLSEPLEFNSELLNRARMQTIRGWEVFCPIPWAEYHPDIGYFGTSSLRRDKLELHKEYGHFDGQHYAIMSFYMEDYKAMREKTLSDVPVAAPPRSVSAGLQPYDLYGAFVKFSSLHVHRAVDPSFRLYYFERTCPSPAKYFYEKACESSRLFALGPHDKVSRLLSEYRQTVAEDARHVNAI